MLLGFLAFVVVWKPFGRLPSYFVSGGVFLLLLVVVVRSLRQPVSEEEYLGRQDRAMSKTRDDPHEMGRWVP